MVTEEPPSPQSVSSSIRMIAPPNQEPQMPSTDSNDENDDMVGLPTVDVHQRSTWPAMAHEVKKEREPLALPVGILAKPSKKAKAGMRSYVIAMRLLHPEEFSKKKVVDEQGNESSPSSTALVAPITGDAESPTVQKKKSIDPMKTIELPESRPTPKGLTKKSGGAWATEEEEQKRMLRFESKERMDAIVPEATPPASPSEEKNSKAKRKWRASIAAVKGAKVMKEAKEQASLQVTRSDPNFKPNIARRIVDNSKFGLCVASVIVAHLIFQGVETSVELGIGPGSASYSAETTFATMYLIELLIRFRAFGRSFFKDAWNVFDLFLIVFSVGDLILVAFISSFTQSLSVIVVLRCVRIFRLVRLFRLFRIFKPLWLLVCGIANSMRTVIWAWLVIGIVVYMFGLIFVRTLDPYALEDPEVREHYGSVGSAMFTVFQVVTLEDWPSVAAPAIRHESWLLICFAFILCTCTWGILNVVVAVFVEGTVDASALRSTDLAKQKRHEYEQGCRKVYEVFKQADVNGDGVLERSEFIESLDKPEIMNEFRSVGIDRQWAEQLFDVLDVDQSGTLDAVEFIEGMMRSLGTAPNKDLVAMRCDMWRVQARSVLEIQEAQTFIQDRMARTLAGISELQDLMSPILEREQSRPGPIRKVTPAMHM
eukprot:gnl/MRDRNA2_/MRDRNA2_117633_c0_seq1.p1 gnl/MRDRNA2_/MRDRNA2_117633_c0~~gnl/MRDRNA2_/MRDRNA2_117633_c0_seq1.p1  ORF type:complete len:654 (-),score=123.78 gnl/MRDRNA2_/MRDRNA2_117633_c0_seq1:24-1985(-)